MTHLSIKLATSFFSFMAHGFIGEDLFKTEFDETYNAAERFENDESKAQGQLQEVWRLL